MNHTRRTGLQVAGSAGLYGALVSIGLLRPGAAAAQALERAAFGTAGVAATLKAMGAQGAVESKDVVLVAPDIADDGAAVRVDIKSRLPRTQMLALLVDKNPNALAGAYELFEGAAPEIGMRIKMGQTSDVVALVKADGKFYIARKEIKVTLGGCGD